LHILWKVFGMRLTVALSPNAEIDGGWLMRRTNRADNRLLLMTCKSPPVNWNLYGQIYRARETREVTLDTIMLPQRTRCLINDERELYETIATANRRLHEEMLPISPRLQPTLATTGRAPITIPIFDHFTFALCYFTVLRKRDYDGRCVLLDNHSIPPPTCMHEAVAYE